jgi:RimJ/RimL family protein N-acetyltransferase
VSTPAFERRTITLRDGRRVVLRAGTPADADAYVDLFARVIPTTDQTSRLPHEIGTLAECATHIDRCGPACGGLLILAEPEGSPGTLIADCGLAGYPRVKLAGVLTVGMMCEESWRGVGLGRAMLSAALAWAGTVPGVRRVELSVLSTNPGAIELYRSLGFVEEGVRRARFRQPDGTLADDIEMVWQPDGR